jgi:fumarate reductase subunit C
VTTQREYVRPIPILWWLRKRSYFIFVMRELSSIAVGWFVLFLSLFIIAVGRGEAAYQNFLDDASHPAVITVNIVALVFVVLHTVTWFSLTPQAMVVRVGGRPVPASAIIASQYVGLLVVSAFVYWLVTR